MCGIAGVVIKGQQGFYKPEEEAFYQLLYVDALRGNDSTGVIAIERDTEFHIAKEASEPAYFSPQFRASKAGRAMFTSGKALIGHNRKKTVGAIKDETAHPFVVDDTFAMVHNGTLYGHKSLADTEVDSEALAITWKACLDAEDIKNEFEDRIPDVHGAYATAMYDQKSHTVRLLRNKERPLWIMETKAAWFFASESGMLWWILSRCGLLDKDSNCVAVDEDTLMTFDLNKNVLVKEKLSPKKAPIIIPPTTPKTTGGQGTAANDGLVAVSKGLFKRRAPQLLGKRIQFWCTDYCEANHPLTEDLGETLFDLFGESEEIEEKHIICFSADKKEHHFEKGVDMTGCLWSGVIESVEYDKKGRTIEVNVVDAKPRPFSYRKVDVSDVKAIERAIDAQATIIG